MPLHPKSREFAKSRLFAEVRSFEQLEKRITKIPENKGKGDAFEVLGIDSYFKNSSVASAPWSWATWSKETFLTFLTPANLRRSILEKLIELMRRM